MKPSKPPRDIKSFKSTEFIVDSDEDSAEEPVVDNTDSDDTEKSSIDSPSASKPKTKSTVVTETRPKGNPLQPSIDPNPISSSAKKAIKEKITIRSSSESQSRENESKEKPGKSSGEIRDDSESRGKSESESDAESSNSVIPE